MTIPTVGKRDLRWRALMVLAQRGDVIAYDTLLHELVGPLKSYFVRRGIADDMAEELCQETLMAAHKARRTYMPHHPFGPWIYAIARFKYIDYLRRRGRQSENLIEAEICVDSIPGVSSIFPIQVFMRALRALTKKQRDVLELLRIRGQSVKAVASALQISESDVKVTAHRAFKIFRDQIE